MDPFERETGRKAIGNKAASGTEIIKELGEEHMRTGSPIVYTSADSVFQIAAHEDVIPIPELYRICEIARAFCAGLMKWDASLRGRSKARRAISCARPTGTTTRYLRRRVCFSTNSRTRRSKSAA